jgi:hypothetical protein
MDALEDRHWVALLVALGGLTVVSDDWAYGVCVDINGSLRLTAEQATTLAQALPDVAATMTGSASGYPVLGPRAD